MKKLILLLVAFVCVGLTMKAQEKIFFSAIPNGSSVRSIYSMNPNGTEKIKLFNDNYHRFYPTPSKDGTEMIYVKSKQVMFGQGDSAWICKSKINGSNETIILLSPSLGGVSTGYEFRGLDWSNDKTKIIYCMFLDGWPSMNRDGDIFLLDLNTNQTTNITNDWDYTEQYGLKFSPDNSKIIYSKLSTPWYAYPFKIYGMNSNGSNNIAINPGTSNQYMMPIYSNDGNKILYLGSNSESDGLKLYMMNSDYSNAHQIIPSSGASTGIFYPCFSPDNSKILFSRTPNELLISDLQGNILNTISGSDFVNFDDFTWVKLGATISTLSQNIYVGKIIDIAINSTELAANQNIIAYQFDYNYDNTKLEYIGNTLVGTWAENGSLQVNTTTTGKLTIAWARQTPMTGVGTGAILKLQFKSIDAGVTTPTITNAFFNTTAVTSITNGIITSTIKYGDIDVNGFVQAYDAALAIQYSVGLDPLPTVDPLPWETWRIKVANVDGVAGVTANDASDILKFTVGLINVFPVGKKRGTSDNAEVNVKIENGNITFRSSGDLFGLNVFVNENKNLLGTPQILNTSMLSATNISATTYAIGLATPNAPKEGEMFMKIPFTAGQSANITFDMIVNDTRKQVTIGLATGIVEISDKNISVFPNPASDILYINGLSQNTKVSIFDIFGKIVFSKQITNSQIDLNGFQSGVYSIKMENSKGIVTRKFVKK